MTNQQPTYILPEYESFPNSEHTYMFYTKINLTYRLNMLLNYFEQEHLFLFKWYLNINFREGDSLRSDSSINICKTTSTENTFAEIKGLHWQIGSEKSQILDTLQLTWLDLLYNFTKTIENFIYQNKYMQLNIITEVPDGYISLVTKHFDLEINPSKLTNKENPY